MYIWYIHIWNFRAQTHTDLFLQYNECGMNVDVYGHYILSKLDKL